MNKKYLERIITDFKNELTYNKKIIISEAFYPYRDKKYPINSYSPGCYIYLGKENKVLYVGGANRHIGRRVWAHLGKDGGQKEPYPDARDWIKEDQPDITIYMISVPDNHWWLAKALEGFLVECLQPERKRKY